jgi:predicted house-cleaning noncanonical NTP pyrophosphatase (MazG superfamily)
MKYEKLIRDKIPEVIEKSGGICKTHVASESEYKELLKVKLVEKCKEYVKGGSSEELADILEVVYALGKTQHITADGIEYMRKKKVDARGGFQKRLVLDEATPIKVAKSTKTRLKAKSR